MRAVDPDLDKRESFLLAAALREAAEGLPEGRRALLVGQPANAAAVPGPADQVIPPMGKGQRGSADRAGRELPAGAIGPKGRSAEPSPALPAKPGPPAQARNP
jgi:hypothetical protein